MNLTAVDAETIIRLATYGIVHLELRATPLHVPENLITYVTESIATHLLRKPSCTVIDIVQEAISVYGKASRRHVTKHQSPQTLYTGAPVPVTAFHYVYASGHVGEFGILVSTVICAAMFSFRLADKCLFRLHDSRNLFAGIGAIILISCFEPYLYTTTVTAYYILLAALFYPSAPVTVECNNEEKAEGMTTHSETISEENHDNHHAMVPDEADNGSIS